MIIIYTNCQGGVGLFPYFKSIWPDTKYYTNYKCPSEIIPDDEIEKCDIFIYQPTKIASEVIRKLKPNCKLVSFPYIYDDGTFSIHYGTCGFAVIDKLLEEGKDVLKMFDEGTIGFDLDNRRKKSIEILKRKEEECTIKISDYIENNRHVPLFFIQSHPTMFISLELLKRILKQLEIDHDIVEDQSCIGWNTGFLHLDQFGFCSYPYSKEQSIKSKSILHLDSYSLKRQTKCLHSSGEIEDFYIVSDDLTRLRISEYIQKKKDESSKSVVCTSLPETEP